MTGTKNPYATSIRVSWLIAAGSAVWLVIAWIALRQHVLAYIWTLPAIFIAGLTAPLMMLYGKSAGREVEMMEHSHLARWTYTDAERREFAHADWKVQQREALAKGAKAAGGMGLVALFVLWLNGDFHSALVPVFLIGVPVGFGVLVAVVMWLIAYGSYRARMTGPGEVIIGYGGVLENGKLTTWSNAWVKLDDVVLESGTPSVLRFHLTQTRGADGDLRVGVPAGKDGEAHKIVKELGKTRSG